MINALFYSIMLLNITDNEKILRIIQACNQIYN